MLGFNRNYTIGPSLIFVKFAKSAWHMLHDDYAIKVRPILVTGGTAVISALRNARVILPCKRRSQDSQDKC